MRIVVIDGQGGRIGKTIIEEIRKELPGIEIIAVGANSIAASAMLKGGATACASGENAVIYNSGKADVICGTLAVAMANSMYGEISPKMANAVCESDAHKFLIPLKSGNVKIMGAGECAGLQYVKEMVDLIKEML